MSFCNLRDRSIGRIEADSSCFIAPVSSLLCVRNLARLTRKQVFNSCLFYEVIMPDIDFLRSPSLFMVHLCPILIGVGLISFITAICVAVHDGMRRLQRLHQVPCSRCTFFTGDYRLKCTVHPCKALSEEAIGCLDFEPTTISAQSTKKCSFSGEASPTLGRTAKCTFL